MIAAMSMTHGTMTADPDEPAAVASSPDVAEAQSVVETVLPEVRSNLARLGADLMAAGLSRESVRTWLVSAVETVVDRLAPPARVTSAADVSGPVWTTEEVRRALSTGPRQITRQAVHDRVQRGTLLALRVREANERAYPFWQFTRNGDHWQVIPGLAEVLRAIPEEVADRWTVASWLQQPNLGLGGQTPLERLKAGGADEQLLAVAEARAARWAR
jgi:hypothetical protein